MDDARLPEPETVPPAVRFLVREAAAMLPVEGPLGEPSPLFLERLEQAYDAGEAWLSAGPELASFALRLLDAREHPTTRRQGCVWATLFPSEEMVAALAAIASSEDEPIELRDQAVWSLGFRQAQQRSGALRWTDATIAAADRVLAELVRRETAAGKVRLESLPEALRHVSSPEVLDALAGAPLLWGDAFEAFATEGLARSLLEKLPDLGEHRLRATRLAAATLGPECLPRLRALAAEADAGERLEILFAALVVGGEPERAALEAAVAGFAKKEPFLERARHHLANPGIFPTVRALRVARTTACMDAAERAAACARAADDLAVLPRWLPYAEAYLYDVWAWMVTGSGDPERARALVALRPDFTRRLRIPTLRDLAARGRVRRVMAVAHEHKAPGFGALLLATHGRPFAALDLADKQREGSAESLAARILGAWLAGRPDLARALAESEAPPVAVVDGDEHAFPGPDERFFASSAPERRPALTAFVRAHARTGPGPERGAAVVEELLDLCVGAPPDAEPDAADVGLLTSLEAHVRRDVRGRTVYVAGELPGAERAAIVERLVASGARVVEGPFPGTDYFVLGHRCEITTVAKLERQGARRLTLDLGSAR